MKKTVYVCGDDEYSSECEINYVGSMVIVKADSDEGTIGIDLVSMMEITGDMVEQFMKKGGTRPAGTLDALEELVRTSREFMTVITGGKVIQ